MDIISLFTYQDLYAVAGLLSGAFMVPLFSTANDQQRCTQPLPYHFYTFVRYGTGTVPDPTCARFLVTLCVTSAAWESKEPLCFFPVGEIHQVKI